MLCRVIAPADGRQAAALPAEFARLDCRNNPLAWLALQQDAMAERIDDLRARHRPARVALVPGPSTSTIGAPAQAYDRLPADHLRLPPPLAAPHQPPPPSLLHFLSPDPGTPGPPPT